MAAEVIKHDSISKETELAQEEIQAATVVQEKVEQRLSNQDEIRPELPVAEESVKIFLAKNLAFSGWE